MKKRKSAAKKTTHFRLSSSGEPSNIIKFAIVFIMVSAIAIAFFAGQMLK